jgi:hypothetical protein
MTGAVLLLAGIVAAAYSVRVAAAQVFYFRAKHAGPAPDTETVLALCESGHRLYPFNFNLAVWAADRAFDMADGLDEFSGRGMFAVSEQWCERALRLNPCRRPARLRMTELVRRCSPAEALLIWQDYVDEHFWDPFNQALLARLRADVGDYEGAERALALTRGTQHHAPAARYIRERRKKQ